MIEFIPRTIHALLDYAFGALLLMSPWVFGFHPGAATAIPVLLGLGAIVYSLFTNYEGGVLRVLSFKTHLLLDVLSGMVFLFAPYFLRTGGTEEGLYQAFGLFEILAAVLTQRDAPGPVPHFR